MAAANTFLSRLLGQRFRSLNHLGTANTMVQRGQYLSTVTCRLPMIFTMRRAKNNVISLLFVSYSFRVDQVQRRETAEHLHSTGCGRLLLI